MDGTCAAMLSRIMEPQRHVFGQNNHTETEKLENIRLHYLILLLEHSTTVVVSSVLHSYVIFMQYY